MSVSRYIGASLVWGDEATLAIDAESTTLSATALDAWETIDDHADQRAGDISFPAGITHYLWVGAYIDDDVWLPGALTAVRIQDKTNDLTIAQVTIFRPSGGPSTGYSHAQETFTNHPATNVRIALEYTSAAHPFEWWCSGWQWWKA